MWVKWETLDTLVNKVGLMWVKSGFNVGFYLE